MSEEDKARERANYDEAIKEIKSTHVTKGGLEHILMIARQSLDKMIEEFEQNKFPPEEQVEKEIDEYRKGKKY